MTQKFEGRASLLIIGLYAIAALTFASGPILEGPNEAEHYRYVRYIADNLALPDPAGYPYGQFHQAPLYYVVGSPVLMLIDDPQFERISERFNPYHAYEFGIASRDNKNFHLHSPGENDTGTAQAVYWLRTYSVLLGTLTLFVNLAAFRLLWPDKPHLRLIGLSVSAFWPQFVYITGMINNDNAMYLTVALSFYLVLKQHRAGLTARRSALLGVALGLALLSKSSAAILCIPMGLVVILDRRWWWPHAPITLGLTILVAGGWYLNNLLLYGDPTGLQAFFATWDAEIIRPGSIAWDVGIERAWFGYASLWGRFGQGAVSLSQALYTFYDLLTLLGGVGALIWIVRRLRAYAQRKTKFAEVQQIVIIVAFSLVWVLALVYSSSIAWSGNQGRYLLPGFAGWSILLTIGLTQFMPQRVQRIAAFAIPTVLGVALSIGLLGYYIPAYRIDPAPEPNAMPLYSYDDVAALLNAEPREWRVKPGDVGRVTLAWRALEATERNLLVYVHSLQNDLIRRDSYPASGLLLAPDWQAGQTWTGEYLLRIPQDAERQQVVTLIVGLYDPQLDQQLTATNAAGEAVTPTIGRMIISAEPNSIDATYRFGDAIGMLEPAITRDGDSLQICITWSATQRITTDYTAFVHVLNNDDQKIAQQDFQPKNGVYPTSVWLPDERVRECRRFEGVTQADSLLIGLYDPATVERLPAFNAAGQALRDRAIRIAL